jgi:hypothetical protein
MHPIAERPHAAREEEALQPLHAPGVVQLERRAVGVEDAQLAARLLEQAIHRGLEALVGVEALVDRCVHSAFLHGHVAEPVPLRD